MKAQYYIFLLATLCVINGCKKNDTAVTKPVEFTSTSYKNLGTYDASGKPDYLTTPDAISQGLLNFINSTLPDGQNLSNSHPEFFSNPAIADITITGSSDVYLTFVSQGGAFANAVAFYTYPTNHSPTSAKDIQLITYAFPNAGYHTPLHPGDKVKLGHFDVGTSLGFVLMQEAWDTTHRTLNNDAVHFCSNDALNPEVDPKLKKHAVLIEYAPENKILIGFEDQNRTSSACDNDFNDVVLYVTVTP